MCNTESRLNEGHFDRNDARVLWHHTFVGGEVSDIGVADEDLDLRKKGGC